MKSNKAYIYITYAISIAIAVVGIYSGWYLHREAKEDKLLTVSFDKIINGCGDTFTPEQKAAFVKQIERQLDCASASNSQWVIKLKQDSATYPQNIIAYTFRNVLSLTASLIKTQSNDSVYLCEALVNDKNAIKISLRFIKKDDKLILTDIENLCPLFKRFNCYEENQKNARCIQNMN